jgi:putative transposase
MAAFKAVQQQYSPDPEILRMLEQFRQMINHCIHIGLAQKLTSFKALSSSAYRQLAAYDIMSKHKLCAISSASCIIRNYRKVLRQCRHVNYPYARKPQFTTCYGFKVKDGYLHLSIKAGRRISIPLNPHTLAVLAGVNVRSVALTARTLSITYSKETAEAPPMGYVGIDRNLDNITIATTDSRIEGYDLSEATSIKSKYRYVKSRFSRSDVRVRGEMFQKYGEKERNRVRQILHHASKLIVQRAKENHHGIVMERLTGIRKLYRKGNGQGALYRHRMNSWSYYELQRQIEYKARWEGLPVIFVNPGGTSSRCAVCGCRVATIPEQRRMLRCRHCGFTVDRDVNAARNILARGVRFAPIALPIEAMVQEPRHVGNPESRWERVNPLGPKPTG